MIDRVPFGVPKEEISERMSPFLHSRRNELELIAVELSSGQFLSPVQKLVSTLISFSSGGKRKSSPEIFKISGLFVTFGTFSKSQILIWEHETSSYFIEFH